MGLSKKLGAITQRVTAAETSDVPYKWSNQTYTVQEILNKFKLPCVVQCATESCMVLWSDFQFDLRQPLLFYSRRTAKKVHATSLKTSTANGGSLEEVGPPLAIPEDYEGWFGATPKGINNIKRHLRIEGVANSTARRFLVTSQCPAFTSSRTPDGNFEYVPHLVMPGEVLKRVCIMEGVPGDHDVPQILKDHGPCLECLDEKDEDVVIPLSRRVLCYELAEEYPEDGERVFRISAPINTGNSKFPRIFQLIHGEPPVLKYAFTGTIRCYSVFTEETILAATLDDPKSICLELATDSIVRFRIGLNEAAIRRTCEYNNANQICQSFGPKFLTGIKVSFSLKPKIAGQDEMSSNDNEMSSNNNEMSSNDNESLSDMQDVNADSEFEIAWGSAQMTKQVTSSLDTDTQGGLTETDVGHVIETAQEAPNSKTSLDTPTTLSIETNQQSSDDSVLRHRQDFTEQDMLAAMKEKGLVDMNTENFPEYGPSQESRVRDNPLYYFMQRNPDKNPFNGLDENCSSESSTTGEDDIYEVADDTPGDVVYDEVKENPLMYLFQPIHKMGQVEETKELAEVTPRDGVQRQLSSASSVSKFERVVCKPAQEYRETYSDSDSDGSDHDGSGNDGNDGDGRDNKFDDSPTINNNIYDIIADVDVIEDINVSDSDGSGSDGSGNEFDDTPTINNNIYDIIADVEDKKYPIYENVSHIREDSIASDFMPPDTDSESEAVNDLMSLALEETEKLSASSQDVSVTSGSLEQSRPAGGFSAGGQTCATQPIIERGETFPVKKDNSDEAVTRLNSLIEEVTALVNTSSNRILDVTRSPRAMNRSRANSNTAKDGDRTRPDDQVWGFDSENNTFLKESLPVINVETTVPALVVQAPSRENVSGQIFLDMKRNTTVSKSDRSCSKSGQIDSESGMITSDIGCENVLTEQKHNISANSTFIPGIPESGRSRSDDTPGVLRRARAETDLPSAAPRGPPATKPTPWPRVVSATSDPVLNTIVSHGKSLDQRFLSRRIVREHPGSPRETLVQDSSPAVGSISRIGDETQHVAQRNMSYLLSSSKRRESLVSPASSVTSLNSSLDSSNSSVTIVSCLNPDMKENDQLSFSEDVLESDSESNSELSHFSVRSERSLVLEKEERPSKGDSHSDLFKLTDKFSFSRSGKLKSGKNKSAGSRTYILSQEFENEDFV